MYYNATAAYRLRREQTCFLPTRDIERMCRNTFIMSRIDKARVRSRGASLVGPRRMAPQCYRPALAARRKLE